MEPQPRQVSRPGVALAKKRGKHPREALPGATLRKGMHCVERRVESAQALATLAIATMEKPLSTIAASL